MCGFECALLARRVKASPRLSELRGAAWEEVNEWRQWPDMGWVIYRCLEILLAGKSPFLTGKYVFKRLVFATVRLGFQEGNSNWNLLWHIGSPPFDVHPRYIHPNLSAEFYVNQTVVWSHPIPVNCGEMCRETKKHKNLSSGLLDVWPSTIRPSIRTSMRHTTSPQKLK